MFTVYFIQLQVEIIIILNQSISNDFLSKIEPIASTKPKVDEGDKLGQQTSRSGTSIRLACLGQAYPRPVYK